FSSNNHPLVLFLDDLQWVDSASLELIKLLYLSEECNYLFLIGSYRENEIDKAHPLQISLENMNSTKPIHYIALRPLNIRNINKIISTTLKCEKEESFSLAEIVQNKTGGNPFFINQFLTTIYNNELIYFDNELKKWKWDVKEIRLRDFSDNIVEIMIQKILTLKEPSRKILQISSCIGNTFNLYFLYIISGRSMEEVVNRLNEPINNSLIFSISDEYKYLLSLELKGNEKEILNSIEFKFSHDRIQQASYSILEENERKNIHLGIARELFSDNKDSDIEENILEIAHHFNQCLDLIEDKIEKLQVIELNFLAGKKAKKSSAFKSAFGYFEAGISCLGENDWEENYSLSLKLYSEIAEASYLIADYEKMETYCSVIEKKSKNILDRAKAFELRTLAFTAGYNFGESLSISFKVLGELKIYFPKNPTDLEIESSYKKLQELIGDKNNSDFINLPLMEDPYKNLSMYFLSLAIPSAYFSLPSLLPLLSFKMIELSIRHGNSILSAVGYSNLGMFLCGMTGEIDKGYSYGILSLDLLEKYQYKNLKCKLYHIFYNFIKHWKEPLKDCLQPLEEAIQVGVEMGDNEYAAYSTGEFCYNSLFCGESLNSIINKSEKYIPLLTKIKQEHIHVVLYFLKQFALNLSDKAEGSSNLKGSFFNIDEALPFFIEKKFGSGAFFVLVLDMILKFLYRKTNEAYNNIDKAFPFIDAVIGIAIVPEYNFYSSLILLSIYEESDVEKKQNILERVQENQKQLKFWAENSPSNHMYKYHLVEAEFYKIINKDYEASINYDIAIEYASTNNFLQGEAIANELAGRFYFSRNRKKISKVYLSDARYVYSLWGANNKVLQLENEFPEIYNLSLDKESLSYLTSDFTSNFFTKTSDSINFQNSGGLDV
ncbi:MAG: hypothetical protein KDK36_06435, partial [Leptospiraceae bacterium]|nr:hypothetical protein [Leptospiraceae bacterium]